MARQKGMLNLSGNIEVNAGAPFDARDIVPTKADLTVASNFPYAYIGMETYVVAENKKYRYMGGGVTTLSNWAEVGSGGGSSVVSGYYKETDHLFYEESTYTTPIVGAENIIYISVDTNKSYRYDSPIFVRIDEEEGQVVQMVTLPTASATYADKIVQFIGATDATYTNGYFYKCKLVQGVYAWVQTNVQPSSGGGTSDYSQLNNLPSVNDVTLLGNKTSADLGLQDAIQIDTMPTASATYDGKIVQYVGTTTASYTHGYYYECINNGGTYAWTQTNVQPNSGGGGGSAGDITYDNTTSGLTATRVQGAIDEIADRANANSFGDAVDITSYSSSSSKYTCQSDGYIFLDATAISVTNGSISVAIDAGSNPVLWVAARKSYIESNIICVRKGMQIYVAHVDTGGKAYFYPLSDIYQLIPFMTSDTTPSGQVIYNSVYTLSGSYAGWKAFDGNDSTGWAAASNRTDNYIGYVFQNAVSVTKAILYNKNEGSSCTCVIQASDDGTTWTNISNSFTFSASTSDTTVELTPSKAYRYYRLTNTSGNSTLNVFRFELYGKPSE